MITRMLGGGIRARYTRRFTRQPGHQPVGGSVIPLHQLGGPVGLRTSAAGGSNSRMKGLTSRTGEPARASRPRTWSVEAFDRGQGGTCGHAAGGSGAFWPAGRTYPPRATPGWPARAAGPGLHVGRVDEVELEDHHQVREGRQPGHRVRSNCASSMRMTASTPPQSSSMGFARPPTTTPTGSSVITAGKASFPREDAGTKARSAAADRLRHHLQRTAPAGPRPLRRDHLPGGAALPSRPFSASPSPGTPRPRRSRSGCRAPPGPAPGGRPRQPAPGQRRGAARPGRGGGRSERWPTARWPGAWSCQRGPQHPVAPRHPDGGAGRHAVTRVRDCGPGRTR